MDTESPLVRLLSPNIRRIYPNQRSREPYSSDDMTLSCLERAGWTPYSGPALTDEKGYIIPNSDPHLTIGRPHMPGDR